MGGFGRIVLHGGGLFFAGAATGFFAPEIDGNINGGTMEPGGELGVAGDVGRIFGKLGKTIWAASSAWEGLERRRRATE